jgi:hypothetical protein
MFALAAACGAAAETSTFSDGDGTPCETVYRNQCGVPCSSDTSCATGLYCSAGACTAECSPRHACTAGFACSNNGRCGTGIAALPPPTITDAEPPRSDAPFEPDSVCADVDVALAKIRPKVLLLLDQSSSMHHNVLPSGPSNECNPSCRWTVLKDVLIGPASSPGGLVKQLEPEADLAVEMYSATDPDPDDEDNSYLTGTVEAVCPRFNGRRFDGLTFAENAFASIDALLRPARVDDDTPTGPAVRTVVGLTEDGGVTDGGFASLATASPKVVVLVTDGEPMLCGENEPSNAGRSAVVAAVQQTYAQNIRTFVIAIGDTTAEAQQHFNAVANAGQGQDPATGDAGAIRPSTQQQLVDALRQIVLGARTCAFDLNGTVQAGLERHGTVTLNGAPVPFDEPGGAEEGWRLVTPSRLELVGAACATFKSTPDAQLTARFPCGAVTPRPTDPR